jgi:hypothetical protein
MPAKVHSWNIPAPILTAGGNSGFLFLHRLYFLGLSLWPMGGPSLARDQGAMGVSFDSRDRPAFARAAFASALLPKLPEPSLLFLGPPPWTAPLIMGEGSFGDPCTSLLAQSVSVSFCSPKWYLTSATHISMSQQARKVSAPSVYIIMHTWKVTDEASPVDEYKVSGFRLWTRITDYLDTCIYSHENTGSCNTIVNFGTYGTLHRPTAWRFGMFYPWNFQVWTGRYRWA